MENCYSRIIHIILDSLVIEELITRPNCVGQMFEVGVSKREDKGLRMQVYCDLFYFYRKLDNSIIHP